MPKDEWIEREADKLVADPKGNLAYDQSKDGHIETVQNTEVEPDQPESGAGVAGDEGAVVSD